jgi:AraC family transcriptional regulator of adaptative response / DNA-3-methyladenine glycosylase II
VSSEFRLVYVPPLDWDAMLGYLAARAIQGVEHVSGAAYRRTITVEGDPAVLEISPGGDGWLTLRVHAGHSDSVAHVAQQARNIFNLDADLGAANRHLAVDPVLGPLIAARPGLRVPGTWDAFELGVRAIIGQQVSVAGAGTIAARLVQRHGTPVPGIEKFGLSHTFPPPAKLARADLSGIGLTSPRTRAIQNFAAALRDRAVRLDRGVPREALVDSLVAIPGIGHWTAHYIALRMGKGDAFPSTDLGLRRALARLTSDGATPAALAEREECWRPWRAQAAIHLWLSER